jgi:hypothetical protein
MIARSAGSSPILTRFGGRGVRSRTFRFDCPDDATRWALFGALRQSRRISPFSAALLQWSERTISKQVKRAAERRPLCLLVHGRKDVRFRR